MKKLLLSLILAFCCGTMMAQNGNGEFEAKWFVSANIGVLKYNGDHNKQIDGLHLSPALDIAVGRWFTPVIGARLMYSGLSAQGATMNGAHATDKKLDLKPGADSGAQFLREQKFNFMNLHADLLVNLSNLICGYNENRIYNASPYAGLGLGTAKAPSTNVMTVNAGLLNQFKVSDAVDINVDLRTVLTGDGFDGEKGGTKGEGLWSVTIGAAYKF